MISPILHPGHSDPLEKKRRPRDRLIDARATIPSGYWVRYRFQERYSRTASLVLSTAGKKYLTA